MKNKILLIFFLILFSSVYSQKPYIQNYNTDNGLPQNSVKDIIKDKYGFIWLTTENGIVRYDGNSFLVYKNFPLNSQRFTYFYGSTEKDSIYTTGEFGNSLLLHRKIPKVVSTNKFPNFILKHHTNYLLYCSNFSYATTSGMNFYINFKEGRYFLQEKFLIYEDFRSKTEKKLLIQPIYNNAPKVFAINGILFFTDVLSKKIFKIEKGEITDSFDVPLLTDRNSKILWSQINNQIFIINKSTVYSCSFQGNQLQVSKIIKLDNVKDENFISIYYDKKYRKLYLGSSIDGLKIINLSDFASVKRPPSKPESVFYSTLPYSSSSVITPFGEIYNRNGIVENKGFINTSPFFMDYDHTGNIMTMNTNDAVIYQKSASYRKNSSIKNLFLKDYFFDSKRYYAVLKDLRNNHTPEFDGILTIYKDQSFQYPEKSIYFKNEPTKLLKLDAANMLVGTTKALYKISLKTNAVYTISGNQQISIRNIIRSRDGNVWITTVGKGFYLFKNDQMIPMPYDAEKNISSSHTILEDAKGYFWIPTNNGLYKVLESELLKYIQNKRYRVNYYKYSKDAGFNTNEFNGGSNICGNQLKNGEFVLPSLNGLVFFNPLKIKSYYPENIYIERAVIDNKEQYFIKNIYLDQKFSRLEVFIDAPFYANHDNVVIEAKLGNSPNAQWEDIGKDRKFSISNLGYGNHTLTVKMLISDDGKFIYKKIHIIIQPYFYQTLWFKIVSFSLLILIIYLLVRWRINFLEKKNRELEEIISSRTQILSDTVEKLVATKEELHNEVEQQKKLIGTITHDITTPVKFIALTAKEVLDGNNFNEQRVEKVLTSIYKSSDQLYNFTITLKEYADIYTYHRSDETEEYSLYQLIEEKRTLFNEIAEKNNTVISNHVDPYLFIQTSKNILSAIVHNLMDNSVKYTQNGTIILKSSIEGENIILLITDSGIGMEQKKIDYYTRLQDNIDNEKLLLQKYGMGLHLVLQLLQMIGGKIIFNKNELQGTSFKLILTNKKND